MIWFQGVLDLCFATGLELCGCSTSWARCPGLLEGGEIEASRPGAIEAGVRQVGGPLSAGHHTRATEGHSHCPRAQGLRTYLLRPPTAPETETAKTGKLPTADSSFTTISDNLPRKLVGVPAQAYKPQSFAKGY